MTCAGSCEEKITYAEEGDIGGVLGLATEDGLCREAPSINTFDSEIDLFTGLCIIFERLTLRARNEVRGRETSQQNGIVSLRIIILCETVEDRKIDEVVRAILSGDCSVDSTGICYCCEDSFVLDARGSVQISERDADAKACSSIDFANQADFVRVL